MTDSWNPYDQHTCGDCGVLEGQIHLMYCDMEECPFCGGQLLSCLCKYKKLKLMNRRKHTKATLYLPQEIYTNGLSKDQREQWESILAKKGYIPFIAYPNMCVRCGALWPEMFHVHNHEWDSIVSPSKRREMLCKLCYDHIVAMTFTVAEALLAEPS